ncbi:hypothetical protein IID20_00445 [Patescibacteria group bacterium]|nr:hypothetical protein [Patescibacteria group bacterium]
MARIGQIIKKMSQRHWVWLLVFFIILIGGLNALLVYAQLVAKEVRDSQRILARPVRIGPVYARGIYISSWTASEEHLLNKIIDFILKTELNAIVIDIKDSGGTIAYASEIEQAKKWGTTEIRIKDLTGLLKKFQSRGIYTIARIVVFRDPTLAQKRPDLALRDKRNGRVWKDNSGIAWLDPASKEVWEYNVAIAKEALNKGFEEVNFDYIRFPSDGSLSNIEYPIWDQRLPKNAVIRGFFAYQAQELETVGRRSADLFGMTLWHSESGYDMNIGQTLADAIPFFDYISPMLYPSHFGSDVFKEFDNPAEHPYEVIFQSFEKIKPMMASLEELGIELPKIRPWLQAFNLGANYKNTRMINLQKQAVKDGGGYGWLLWNARNDYYDLEEALKK